MNIIYVSSGCSEEKFEELRKNGITKKLPQAQKYHQLMVDGLAYSAGGKVDVISAIPTNRSWSKKIFFHREQEEYERITYHYIPFINIPFLSQISKYYAAKRIIKNISETSQDVAIICDILNQSIADAARMVGNSFGIPVVGIVTDVPGYTSGARRKSYSFFKRKIADFAEKRAKKSLDRYKAYLFLTQAMDEVVSRGKKPYIVIEGQCDYSLKEIKGFDKSVPRIAMYAGGIHKEFGIERMVKAFVEANCSGWELHIFGDGNFQDDLMRISEINKTVKYHGVVSNQEVTRKQLEASLLLNPRLTDAEYVKYSFPSKTLECMASGTPLLTTKLPGMPEEYYPYVYLFEDESQNGMMHTFKSVLSKSNLELANKGNSAKEFVIHNKNNIDQAKRLLAFIKTLK
jgi:glycosyltransferase involved in cell wall biosynthesis